MSQPAIRLSVSMVTYNSSFDLLCKTVDALHYACDSDARTARFLLAPQDPARGLFVDGSVTLTLIQELKDHV